MYFRLSDKLKKSIALGFTDNIALFFILSSGTHSLTLYFSVSCIPCVPRFFITGCIIILRIFK